MQRRFRQAFTALREHTSVSYAKIATVGGFCNVELIVIKATAPDDLPLPEKYIQELLKIFSISAATLRDFSLSFCRRFGKTRCWRVALKCLILLHRLLRAVPEDSAFRTELLCTRSIGLMSLNNCRFRDDSSSASADYTAFIRSYAQLLDEVLHCFCLDNKAPPEPLQQHQEEGEEGDDEDEREEEDDEPQFQSLSAKMEEISRMLEMLPQLQSLIDRVMDCRPTGPAAKSFLVQVAMKLLIRDSFVCYTIFRKEIVMVLDSLFQMPYRNCISAFGIYKKAAVQATELCEFYDWCRAMGICGAYEYPFIDRIPHIQIHALENFLHGMWQLTDQSSSTPTSSLTSSFKCSSETLTEDETHGSILVSTKWEKPLIQFGGDHEDVKPLIGFGKEEAEKMLIQFEEVDESWETILEASINVSPSYQQNNMLCLYNPNVINPFYKSSMTRQDYHGLVTANNTVPSLI
ncbi:probable clathrin assembly protein At4g32285 [Argentina anserina]|uniref:probable clathrin assembly protein At4g32285 n=1 Tax=Argentina anserina TaxID=57926 RepID=UPI0021764F9A|nr:probable clathrin assembly protein At4g32285 [Potentilla anserina]